MESKFAQRRSGKIIGFGFLLEDIRVIQTSRTGSFIF